MIAFSPRSSAMLPSKPSAWQKIFPSPAPLRTFPPLQPDVTVALSAGVTLDKYHQYTDSMAMGVFHHPPSPCIPSTGPAVLRRFWATKATEDDYDMLRWPHLVIIFSLLCSHLLPLRQAAASDAYATARHKLVETIRADVLATSSYLGVSSLDQRVLAAMAKVPRHEFVAKAQRPLAYRNRPLPIGYGQTISQPYIVAVMSQLLEIKPGDAVLEVGTGSGYQAAILSELARQVYTIEIIKPLGIEARQRLAALGYDNVEVLIGDGYYGWPGHNSFDAIMVTAAASHIPPPLVKQLKPGGKMVIPVGSKFMIQQLVVVEKKQDGSVRSRQVLPVRFVPLTGGHGTR